MISPLKAPSLLQSPAAAFLFSISVLLCVGCVKPESSHERQEEATERSTPPPAEAEPPPEPASDEVLPHRTPAASEVPAGSGPSARADLGDGLGAVREVSGPELKDRIRKSRARATLVNAWASWCGPCRREFPMLEELKTRLARDGVDVVFISMDEPDTRAQAIAFAQEHGETPPFLVARRPLGPFKRSLHEGWPGMLPATFLFDAQGILRHFWGGPVYESELMPVVKAFLEGNPIEASSNFALTPGRDFRGQAATP